MLGVYEHKSEDFETKIYQVLCPSNYHAFEKVHCKEGVERNGKISRCKYNALKIKIFS